MFRNLKKQTAFILLVLITLLMTMSTALATTYVGSVKTQTSFITLIADMQKEFMMKTKFTSIAEMKPLIVAIFLAKYAVHEPKKTLDIKYLVS